MRSFAWSAAGSRSRERAAASLCNCRKGSMFHLLINLSNEESVILADEDGSAKNGAPKAALVADGGLRDVHGANNFVGDAVDLFFFVERQIGIKFHVQSGGEQFRSELFGILAGHFFGFAEGMMLRQVSIHALVARERQANAGGDEAMRFPGGMFADDGKSHLAGPDVFQAFAAGNQFAVGRGNRGDADNVTGGNSCVPERELETGEPFPMLTDAFGEEDLLGNERHGAAFR